MKILIVEPFFSGSHQVWAEGYKNHSNHHIKIISLPGRHWKWRMHGGAISLAKQFKALNWKPDLILATDMLDLSVFLALCKKEIKNTPVAIYFHENQLTYPWSSNDPDVKLKRDNHYAFINYTSALAADAIFFNSKYHRNSFLEALPDFLNQFPDHSEKDLINTIKNKSEVLLLGMNLKKLEASQEVSNENDVPVILWNHRWEYDKNPDLFFESLFQIQEEKIPFQLIVLGDSYSKQPKIFNKAKTLLKEQLIHFGYADSYITYSNYLWQADIAPVTSHQDFFGGSVVEAIYCNCFPILPNRLAYPQHIPEKEKGAIFYEQDAYFYSLLKKTIINHTPDQLPNTLSNFVARYDWSILAPEYDLRFEFIVDSSFTSL